MTLNATVKGLPGGSELDMGIKEARHLPGGHFPALDARTNEPLSLLIAHNFDEARVALVDILFQRPLQLLWETQHTKKCVFVVRRNSGMPLFSS